MTNENEAAAPTTASGQVVRFGVGLYTGQGSVNAGQGYRDALTLAAAAETAGFDSFWVSEHHGWADSYLPSPLVVLAALAASTHTIELGAGLALAPLYHPMRLAEDVAVVDQLSGGRLVLGLGLGYLDSEYALYGIERRARVARLVDAVAILRLAAGGARFSYHGRTIDVTDVVVTPRHHRPGGVPVWLGGYASSALRRAARVDGHLIGRGSDTIVDDASEQLAAVRSPQDPTFTRAVNVVVVLDDTGGASASARAAFESQQLSYERQQAGRNVYSGLVAEPGGGSQLSEGSIDSYIQVAGSADAVVDGLRRVRRRLAGWSAVHIILRIVFPGEGIDDQLERIETFGRRVLPAARRDLPDRE